TYGQAIEAIGIGAAEFYHIAANDAFMIRRGEADDASIMILTRDMDARGRFSLAHELGHIALGHEADDARSEYEANAFAAEFLCPRPVLKALGLRGVSEVARIFSISRAAARIALDNADMPCRAAGDAVERVKGRFEAYINKYKKGCLDAPAGFYAARPDWSRDIWQLALRNQNARRRRFENALDDMERLIETRI
ncbi:MAG: ImmA/IrrE family metallo-endopeptidase, partial [Clostridia bacterium]|nr:ImmA/IrrE family metallo-endopeptidase [Clostridia bacterium]